jgi:hypothetical protein
LAINLMNLKLHFKDAFLNPVQNRRNEKQKEILTPPCFPKARAA